MIDTIKNLGLLIIVHWLSIIIIILLWILTIIVFPLMPPVGKFLTALYILNVFVGVGLLYSRRWLAFKISLGIFLGPVIGLFACFTYLGYSYDLFLAELPAAKKQLVAMNHETLAKFPLPDGVVETKRKEWQGDFDAVLNVEYEVENPDLDVLAYYNSLMERQGWRLAGQDTQGRKYFNNKSCVEINVSMANGNTYSLDIYQDFPSQPFIHHLPPDWYFGLRTAGERELQTCP